MSKRILIVDDDRVFRLILTKTLLNQGHDFDIDEVENAAECLQILEKNSYDAILLDYELGDKSGLELLPDILNLRQSYTPIIIISAHEDDNLMYRCLQKGAQDYLVKDAIDRRTLFRSIRYSQERSQILRRLELLANFDSLTQVANRANFMRQAKHFCHSDEIDKFALYFIDIDNFKPINDNYGHDVGDAVLQYVAEKLQTTVRQKDFVARLGGDEFAILLRCGDENNLLDRRAQQLMEAITGQVTIQSNTLTLSCSIGFAQYPKDSNCANDLIRKADHAMYDAKRKGKNTWRRYQNGQKMGINDSATIATTIVKGTPTLRKSVNL